MIRSYVLHIILITALIFGCDYLIGKYFSFRFEKNTCEHAGGDLCAFLKSDEVYDTLIIGSSRVNTMINPNLLGKKVTNLSKPAKHFYYSVSVADLLYQYRRLPKKTLIVNIELEDVFIETEERLIEDVCYLKYYYGKNDFITSTINERGIFERLKFIFSSYRFNGENFKLLTNPLQDICDKSENGFFPLIKGKNDKKRLKQGLLEMKKLHYTAENPHFDQNIIHLKKLCDKARIQLIFIHGPNYFIPEYMQKGDLIMDRICKKNGISFINFSKLYDNEFHFEPLWYDHLHLNSDAANNYTLLVKEELKKLKKPATKNRGIIH